LREKCVRLIIAQVFIMPTDELIISHSVETSVTETNSGNCDLMSKRISAAVLSLVFICGFIDAWAGRRSYVAGDTISYMDMASGGRDWQP